MMFNGIEIPGIQSRIRTEYLLVNIKMNIEIESNKIQFMFYMYEIIFIIYMNRYNRYMNMYIYLYIKIYM
jgi:hypothetical protein